MKKYWLKMHGVNNFEIDFSGFCSGVGEISVCVGCDAAAQGIWWWFRNVGNQVLSVSASHPRKADTSHLYLTGYLTGVDKIVYNNHGKGIKKCYRQTEPGFSIQYPIYSWSVSSKLFYLSCLIRCIYIFFSFSLSISFRSSFILSFSPCFCFPYTLLSV